MPVVLGVLLLSGACGDWTESENLDFRRPTPEEQNPEAYRLYLAAVRAYKQQPHKVAMMTVKGSAKRPSLQNQHLMAMPDSVDFICVEGTEGLHADWSAEMAALRETKGTRTLCMVDYAAIESSWNLLEEAREEAGKPLGTDEEFVAYYTEQTRRQLAACDGSGFDGIVVSYLGRRATARDISSQNAFMGAVREWRATHADRLMLIRGNTQNLLDENKPLLKECDYIIVLSEEFKTPEELTRAVRRKIDSDDQFPSDRFLLEVSIPSLEDPAQVGADARVGAEWVVDSEEGFSKLGLGFSNAQDDYFNAVRIYNNIRQAICIMNTNTGNDHEEIQ